MTFNGKVASGVVEGLKNQPLSLALVVVNALFLLAAVWVVGQVTEQMKNRDAMMLQLARDCAKGDKS